MFAGCEACIYSGLFHMYLPLLQDSSISILAYLGGPGTNPPWVLRDNSNHKLCGLTQHKFSIFLTDVVVRNLKRVLCTKLKLSAGPVPLEALGESPLPVLQLLQVAIYSSACSRITWISASAVMLPSSYSLLWRTPVMTLGPWIT